MHPTNNKEVFEASVRQLLHVGNVTVVEQELPGLPESIEHGNAATDSLLNLIVRAHVAYLILHVSTPFDMDTWTERLSVMEPRLRQGIERCHQQLTQNETANDSQPD